MTAGFTRMTACSVALMMLLTAGYLPAASAQDTAPPPPPDQPAPPPPPGQPSDASNAAAPVYAPEQLDQLVAPIALYPDPLLSQALMAATYPLEVVEAARWVAVPANAQLRGDQLDAALQPMDWDPSVKSLVPFPQILKMMDSKLDWTQSLGNAFLAQQSDVMNAVQRLRAQAQSAGTLQTTAQQTVSTQGQDVVIEPANPNTVYVPYYNPATVYGTWPYPDYPPIYFPPPPGYGYVAGPVISFGIGLGIVGALWGWDSWDWGHHDIHIDDARFNHINNYVDVHRNRPQFSQATWQHDPTHRRGVPYSAPAVRQKYQRASAPTADARRDFRGFDNRAPAARSPAPAARGPAPAAAPRAEPQRQASLPPAQQRANEARPQAARPAPAPARPAPTASRPAPTASRPATPQPQQRAAAPPAQHAAAPRPMAPAYSSFGRGADVRTQSQRGQASRQTMAAAQHPAPAPHPAPQRSAPPPAHAAPAAHSAPPPHSPPPQGKKP